MRRGVRQGHAASLLTTTFIAIGALAACAAAASAAALPGPPPGAGSGFPLPPSASADPPAPAAGPASVIPSRVPGAALANGSATVPSNGRVALHLTCAGKGKASLTVPQIAAKAAATKFTCKGGGATVRFRLASTNVRAIGKAGVALGQVTIAQGHSVVRPSVALSLAGRSSTPGVWSDGGLECNTPGPNQTYLVAPNFTVSPPTPLSVRPWVAWHTNSGGWRWLGLGGYNRSSWISVTGTANGVAQWHNATGAFVPWTWGPITAPTGSGVQAIGVFEVIYWFGGRPTYVWKYTRSFVGVNVAGSFCSFP